MCNRDNAELGVQLDEEERVWETVYRTPANPSTRVHSMRQREGRWTFGDLMGGSPYRVDEIGSQASVLLVPVFCSG